MWLIEADYKCSLLVLSLLGQTGSIAIIGPNGYSQLRSSSVLNWIPAWWSQGPLLHCWRKRHSRGRCRKCSGLASMENWGCMPTGWHRHLGRILDYNTDNTLSLQPRVPMFSWESEQVKPTWVRHDCISEMMGPHVGTGIWGLRRSQSKTKTSWVRF